MTLSDEKLTAYVDGELDAAGRAEVEAAAAADAETAARLRGHQALRAGLVAAFDPAPDEPAPERLLRAIRDRAAAREGARLVDLAQARARRRLPAWASAGAMAACLAAGIWIGGAVLAPAGGPLAADGAGALSAKGELAQALDRRLASDPTAGKVAVGVSFASHDGPVCRTFTVTGGAGSAGDLAGLACRDDDGWRVRMAMAEPRAAAAGPYRMAASSLPPPLAAEVDAMMAGEAFDMRQEAAARVAGWRAPKRR